MGSTDQAVEGLAADDWVDAREQLEFQRNAISTISRDGAEHQYLASTDSGSDPEVHRLLRDKYGLADRLVRFWWGTDTETGILTGEACRTVPIRLLRQ
jgi:hypothetical protein